MPLALLSLNSSLHAFAAAAPQLHPRGGGLCVTQAAVSQQIKALEAQVSKPLFLRTARGLQLSDEGARLAPPCSRPLPSSTPPQACSTTAPPERLTVAVVGAYLHGHLLARVPDFEAFTPHQAAPANP